MVVGFFVCGMGSFLVPEALLHVAGAWPNLHWKQREITKIKKPLTLLQPTALWD